jgi:phage gp29-like protein
MVNSRILDHKGDPISYDDIDSVQSEEARLAFLAKEFGDHPSRGLTPAKLSRILIDAERGDLVAQCELFEDIEEKDGHVFSEMAKRKRALLGVDWRITPPPNPTAEEEKLTDQVRELFNELTDIDDLILDMADAIGKGYSCNEIEWGHEENVWLPRQLHHRPASWFTVDEEDRNRLMLRTQGGTPVPLRNFGWISHVHKSKSGYIARGGLGRVLAWPFLFKNYSVRDLAEFLEIYGLPLRLGKYPSGASDLDKATLLRAVVGIGHNAAGIIPEGMEIDFKEAAKGASGPFEFMVSWCEKTQSKAILGGTLTSQADGKSSTNALGNVHNEVRVDLRNSDLKQVAATLTRDLIFPMVAVNGGGIRSLRRSPRFVFDTQEPEDLALYSDALPKLADAGARIPLSYIHNKLQIPEPEENEAILQPSNQVQSPTPTAALTATASVGGLFPDQKAINELIKGVDAGEQQEQSAKLLEPILAKIHGGADLSALEGELSELYPDLDTNALEEKLAQLFFVSEVWGRLSTH